MDGVVTSHIYNSKFPISVFVIVRPVGAALIYADRRTDGRTVMTDLIGALTSYANATQNVS